MELWQVVVFGIIEGVTEFLPVSSTGHLILTAKILNLFQSEFLKSFEIAIQLGAIFSVAMLYWRSLLIDRKMFAKVMAAFLPTAVLGTLFYKFIKSFLFARESIIVIALFAGGVILVIFEFFYKEKPGSSSSTTNITFKQAFIIGTCQALAMIPGVSRSLATILAGLSMGLQRKTIVQFSFLLAIPTMLCATAFDLTKSAANFTWMQLQHLTVGFIVSFLVAFVVVRTFVRYVEKNNFIAFGIYRIMIALLLVALVKMNILK